MEEENGFYKLEVGAKRNELLFGQALINKDWKLTLANKHEFSFPHDGWNYFENLTEACAFYNIDEEEYREHLFPSLDVEEIN